MRVLLLLLGITTLFATEREPWTEVDLAIYLKGTLSLQEYHTIKEKSRKVNKSATDGFLTLSARGSYDKYALEIEATGADGSRQGADFESYSLTGRYRLLDDTLGDALSLWLGAKVTGTTHPARHRLGSFYNGGIEGEFFASAGREWDCRSFWVKRLYGVFAVGVADLGSPWLNLEVVYRTNVWNDYGWDVLVSGLIGLGSHTLDPDHFYSWGPIRHRSVNVGARVFYQTRCYGKWFLSYERTVFAYNWSNNMNCIKLAVEMPFGF